MLASGTMGQEVQRGYDPVQTHKSFDLSGKWFAARNYELRDGVISPKEGSPISEYDPWDVYRRNLDKYRTVSQPYVDLLNLSRKLDDLKTLDTVPTSPLSRTLTPLIGAQNDADRILLKWFEEHGALGILPVLAEKIALPVVAKGRNSVTQTVYVRDGGIWFTCNIENTRHAVGTDGRTEATKWVGTAWLDWKLHTYEPIGIEADRLEKYFPHVADRVSFPNPQSSEFQRVYGEPVREFVKRANQFREAVDILSECDMAAVSTADDRVRDAISFLTGLTKAAGPSYQTMTWPITEVRVSAGLLASYALMFLWDLEDGRKALRCRNCSDYFVSNDVKAGYCSPRCRNTAQSRRYRHSLAKNGESK